MRVVLALGTEALTTKEIHARVPDVAQATLYRAISRLLNAGQLEVAEHRKRGGAIERVYRVVAPDSAGVAAVRRDVVTMTPEAAQRLSREFAALLDRAIAEGGTGDSVAVSYGVIPTVVRDESLSSGS